MVWYRSGLKNRARSPTRLSLLARGPVHEAFAEPAGDRSRARPVVAKEPPEPIEELPPEQKPEGDNVHWIPGYWAWDEEGDDFLWVSGFWRDVAARAAPGCPATGRRCEDGWQWVPGFWAAAEQADESGVPAAAAGADRAPARPCRPRATTASTCPGCWV